MAKNDLFDFDGATPGNNTDIEGNNIAEGNLPGTLNNALRSFCAILKRAAGTQGADIASATTTNIAAAGTSLYAKITGTTTITGFGTVAAGTLRIIEFTGALTLTHNATSLILPGGANITTAAGDVLIAVSEGSGNWRVASYVKASGAPVVSVATGSIANDAVTYAKIQNVSAASRLLGRGSAGGAGDTEEIALGTGLSMSGTTLSSATKLAQVVRDTDVTYVTASTDMPIDDTPPQNTEGEEVLAVSITPTNASSILRITATLHVGQSSAGIFGAALFVDSTASALDAVWGRGESAGSGTTMVLVHTVSAASTSARTYKIRLGPAVGGPANVFLNGDSGSRLFGGVMTSRLEVEEILP